MTYLVGTHWFICDVCGQKYRSTEKKKRWDGLIVCPSDFEQDHPQKFIRVEADGQAVPNPRPRPEDVFKEGLACTLLTRTPTSDVGIADCMTVDSIPNINWPDYNLPRPIIPASPTPILLDTFSAADGTNPTARDLDIHPSGTGASRWRETPSTPLSPSGNPADDFYPNGPGRILSNKLRLSPSFEVTAGAFAPSTIITQNATLELFADTPSAFVTQYPVFMMLAGNDANTFTDIYLERYGVPDYWATMSARGEAQVNGPDGAISVAADTFNLMLSNGAYKFGLYFTQTEIKVIRDGAVVASATGLTGIVSPAFDYCSIVLASKSDGGIGTTDNGTALDSAAVYQGISLSEAITLTT